VIEAVSRIGEYIQRGNGGDDLLSTFIENPNSNGKFNRELIVVLKEKDGGYSFDRVDFQEFKDDKFTIYLYKKGTPNGTDATPTSKIAGDLSKTYQKRFIKWFQNYESYDVTNEERDDLKRMKEVIEEQKDVIQAELEEKYSQKDPKDNAIITLGFDHDGEIRHLKDRPVFQNILIRTGKDKYSVKKSQGVSLGKNAVCSVCKAKKGEVYGYAIPWTFHTFDKPGFIAGGFEVSESWKNTPVCFDCATNLEVGKKWIEENLNFGFYGFQYLLVPKLVMKGDVEEILKIIGAKDLERKQRLTKEMGGRLTNDEDEILSLIKDKKDSFSNSLIFYKKEQSSYRILLHIDGILPSRLRALFEAKAMVDKRFRIYNENILTEKQKEKIKLEFNFGVLRQFLPRESRNRSYDKIFLEMANKIFVGNSIDYHLLMDFIMREIRKVFIEGEFPTNLTTLNGFMLLHYLKELNLLVNANGDDKNMIEKNIGVLKMEELEGLPLKERTDRFFQANAAFFKSEAKKAAFLEGVLAQKLLNIQWSKRSSTPFRAKLHGLKMNQKLLKRLLPDMQNKLEEYESNYYKDLEELIAHHFVCSGVDWEETDDELSFYFVLGMDLHKLFSNKKEENDSQEEA